MKPAVASWITCAEAAMRIGVARWAVRRAGATMEHADIAWAPARIGAEAEKVVLRTKRMSGGRGGKGGSVILIYAPSIPASWLAPAQRASEPAGPALPAPIARQSMPVPVTAPPPAVADEAAAFSAALAATPSPPARLSMAARFVLERTHERTTARNVLVANIASNLACSAATLRRAMAQLEAHQDRSLIARKRRADAGEKRCHLSGPFDAFALGHGIARERLPELAEKVFRSIRGGWQDATGASVGWRHIRANMGRRVTQIFAAFGASVTLDRRDVERLIPKHVVLRFRHHIDVAIWRHDAGRHHNVMSVPVQRTAEGLAPAEVFCIDATVANIQVICADGIARAPRIVGCMDVYSGWTQLHVIKPEARRGVRQEDGLVSLALMCRDFGVPTFIQRDNGGEFDLPEVYRELGMVARQGLLPGARPARNHPDIVAKPYNTRSKPIEAAFRKLQRGGLALIPGDYGGAWATKKTHQQGQAPNPKFVLSDTQKAR